MKLTIKWDSRGNALIRVPGSKEWHILDELTIDLQQGVEDITATVPIQEGSEQWRTMAPTGKKTLSITGSWQQ